MNVGRSMHAHRRVLGALSPFLLIMTALGGFSASVAPAASAHPMMYRPVDPARTRRPHSASAISDGIQRHLKTVFVTDILDDPTNNENSAEVYPALQQIGRQEGFTVKVVAGSPSVWIRDDFVSLSDGVFLAPSQNRDFRQALRDLRAYRDPPGHVYNVAQGRVGRRREIAVYKLHARANGLVIRVSRVYLEGGNVMVIPKADGTKGVLIGMSSLLMSTFLLSREGAFAADASFSSRLRATRQIIADELGVDPAQVTYLDQPEFHLDMFLTPGVNGQVFIEDPAYSNATVNALLRSPGLSRAVRDALRQKLYPAPALSTLQAELKPVISELWRAGYRVIGIPGEFNRDPGKYHPFADTDFMNGLVATGKNGKKYDITGQSPTAPLNGVFRKVMARYGITVFFVPDARGLLYQRGSIHCVTNEQIEP